MTAPARTRDFSPDERAFIETDEGRDLAAIAATGCPAPAVLSAAAHDAIPGELAAVVSANLERCGICRQLQSDLLAIDPGMDALEEARIRRRIGRPGRTPVWRVAALAASVTIAVSGALLATRVFDAGTLPSAPAYWRICAT